MQTNPVDSPRTPRAPRTPRERATEPAPHSWDIAAWPQHVWPHDPKRAKWLVKAYRTDLLYHRALTRIGKRLVVLGDGYLRFMTARAKHVTDFESNNNDCGRSMIKPKSRRDPEIKQANQAHLAAVAEQRRLDKEAAAARRAGTAARDSAS